MKTYIKNGNVLRYSADNPPPKFRFENGVSVGAVEIHPGVSFGMYSYINSGFIRSGVVVGRYCSIGRNVTIGSGAHDYNAFSTSPFFKINSNHPVLKKANPDKGQRVVVGNDVWIGDNVYIMSGVNVGDGAIIAAGSIVTKDVAPYSIVKGVPAKHYRWRFDREIIEKLAELRWYEFSTDLLKSIDIGMLDEALSIISGWDDSSRIHKYTNYSST